MFNVIFQTKDNDAIKGVDDDMAVVFVTVIILHRYRLKQGVVKEMLKGGLNLKNIEPLY